MYRAIRALVPVVADGRRRDWWPRCAWPRCGSSSGGPRRASAPHRRAGPVRVERPAHRRHHDHLRPAAAPTQTELRLGSVDLQRHQQGRHRRQRGRAAQRRADPRREGEPAAGLLGLVRALARPGRLHPLLPGRDEREDHAEGHRHRGASAGPTDVGALLKAGHRHLRPVRRRRRSRLWSRRRPTLDTALHGTDLAAAQNGLQEGAGRTTSGSSRWPSRSPSAPTTSTPTSTPATATSPPTSGRASTASRRACSRPTAWPASPATATGWSPTSKKLQTLTTGLTYQPAELANGAVDLLDEVAKSKITGEEERYSHIDLLDFQANVEGAEQAFANLQPGLVKIDATLLDHGQRRRSPRSTRCSTSTAARPTRRASCSTAR